MYILSCSYPTISNYDMYISCSSIFVNTCVLIPSANVQPIVIVVLVGVKIKSRSVICANDMVNLVVA
ncbi:unnamed protein product [Trifolium pratense]|uniref:Uncharacterized protein n=1 Tax=Trifolium pratense TaxID=57577 RepID=A0ACB0I7E3_TRIPR|nr:unnamed protein product [Trifolium pratense]